LEKTALKEEFSGLQAYIPKKIVSGAEKR